MLLILLAVPFIGGLAVMWLESDERATRKMIAQLVKQSQATKQRRYYQ